MIAKYINNFSILSMFTPIDYNTLGIQTAYYWIIIELLYRRVFFLFFFENDSVSLISIWI